MRQQYVFLFFILLILAGGCTGIEGIPEAEEDIPFDEDYSASPEDSITKKTMPNSEYEMDRLTDEANGYSINLPKGWSSQVENNQFLAIYSPDKASGAIIWPVVLEGKYKEMTIKDLTNYIVGLIIKQYPNFKKEKIFSGPREDSMEVIGTFTVNGINKKVSIFAYLENGYGMVSSYEAPLAEFEEKEPILRRVISSYQNKQSSIEKQEATGLPLSKWSDGIISIDVPAGWATTTGGQCSTKYFISQDPASPISQVFYFQEIGPFYLTEEKKIFDQQYVAMGGYNLFWTDAPVISPVTPENFLTTGLKGVAEMSLTKQLAPNVPRLENVNVISAQDSNLPLGFVGQQKVITAEFEEKGVKGKGQFLVVTTEFPQMGLGYAMTLIGLSSSPEKFDSIRNTLLASLQSFTMDQTYINNCIAAQNQAAAGALKAGKTLSEASDIIMGAYEYRQQAMDKINEQWDDVVRGRERLYDPGTETVYSVPTGFKDYYNTNRDSFETNNLQELPEDRWNEVPLDGETHII